MGDIDAAIERAAQLLARAEYAVALVGAGISVESGIPPFRGTGGIWTKHGEPPMDGYQRAMEDLHGYWQSLLARRASNDEFTRAVREARPNAAHHALAALERAGVLRHTITQNIDNLHAEAGQRAVTEIHGNRTKLRCIDCGARWPFAEFALAEVPPACPECRGMVKGDTVMFGEPIPRIAMEESVTQAGRADCMLLAGTSATVTPAALLPQLVLNRGGAVIEVNPEPTPFSRRAAVVLRGAAGELLPRLAEVVAALNASQRVGGSGRRSPEEGAAGRDV